MSREVTLGAEVRSTLSVHPLTAVRRFGVDAFVTDRFGGVSVPPYDSLNLGDHVGDDARHVAENRRRVAAALGVERLVIVHQVHGATVVDASQTVASSEADAIVSLTGDDALGVLVADCVPILLVDEHSGALAVVHAGWRGLVAGVVGSTLNRFPSGAVVHAFIGPAISAEAYQIGPEVAEHFADVPGALHPDGGDRSRLDLRHVSVHQLRIGGVDDGHIELARQTTDGGAMFFSDRAQRPCGRFGLFAKRAVA